MSAPSPRRPKRKKKTGRRTGPGTDHCIDRAAVVEAGLDPFDPPAPWTLREQGWSLSRMEALYGTDKSTISRTIHKQQWNPSTWQAYSEEEQERVRALVRAVYEHIGPLKFRAFVGVGVFFGSKKNGRSVRCTNAILTGLAKAFEVSVRALPEVPLDRVASLSDNKRPSLSEEEHRNALEFLRDAIAEFRTVGVAKILGIAQPRVSNALHTSGSQALGPTFAKRLATAFGEKVEDVLSGAAKFKKSLTPLGPNELGESFFADALAVDAPVSSE